MPNVPTKLPRYRDLPAVPGNPPKTAWGLFGPDDNVGMFNLQTPEIVVAAAKLVRKGAVFAMNWEQEKPNPPLFGRGKFRHTVFREIPVGHHGDDCLDNFFTQASSQWDGLTHVGDYEHGFWGGVKNEELREQPRQIAARHRPLGAARHRRTRGGARRRALARGAGSAARLRHERRRSRSPISKAPCRAQKVELKPGDVWIIHLGWIAWYEQQSPQMKPADVDHGDAEDAGPRVQRSDGRVDLRPPSGRAVLGQSRARVVAAAELHGSRRVSCITGSSAASAWRSARCSRPRSSPPTARATASTKACSCRRPSTSPVGPAVRRTRW